MMNFGGKPPIFAILRQFLDNPTLFMENLPKKGPLFGEFGAQKSAQMGGTYPYPHVLYPPPRDNTHSDMLKMLNFNKDLAWNKMLSYFLNFLRNLRILFLQISTRYLIYMQKRGFIQSIHSLLVSSKLIVRNQDVFKGFIAKIVLQTKLSERKS